MAVMDAVSAGRGSMAPERSLRQRLEALERGNAIRSHRAELKRDVKTRRKSVHDVLAAPEPEEVTMKVLDLLLAVPKVGRVKAGKWLNRTRISPSKTVGGLTERQRFELCTLIGHR